MHQYTVCVAEDCEDENALLSAGLCLNGYEALSAFTGRQALEVCRRETVDVLLLDVSLPDMDGYEVCRQLKADRRTAGIPVVFLTAHSETEDVIRG